MRVRDVEIGAVDVRLIDLERAFVGRHGGLLRLQYLLSDGIVRNERLISLQICLRVLQGRLILDELALRLSQLHLIWTRIDVDKGVALAYALAFAVVNSHQ